jgi:hypothetical protein
MCRSVRHVCQNLENEALIFWDWEFGICGLIIRIDKFGVVA